MKVKHETIIPIGSPLVMTGLHEITGGPWECTEETFNSVALQIINRQRENCGLECIDKLPVLREVEDIQKAIIPHVDKRLLYEADGLVVRFDFDLGNWE